VWSGASLGCSPAASAAQAPVSEASDVVQPAVGEGAPCPVAAQRELDGQPEVIEPERRAPAFRVSTADCQVLDSRGLIGSRAFVVAFFATWCEVCELKLPLLQRALAQHTGQLPLILVSLDDDQTWPDVPEYLARHGLEVEPVRGHDFMPFSLGYNPFGAVPLTVVVGRSGRVLDVQLGLRRTDFGRLMQAMDSALAEPPEPAAAAPTL
jgi:thiol-disulfide isomerase/thioredoxin